MKIVNIVFLVLCGGVFLISLNVYLTRLAMPYNSNGRYFDGAVVYKDYAVSIYGFICLIFGILSAGLVFELIRAKRRSH